MNWMFATETQNARFWLYAECPGEPRSNLRIVDEMREYNQLCMRLVEQDQLEWLRGTVLYRAFEQLAL